MKKTNNWMMNLVNANQNNWLKKSRKSSILKNKIKISNIVEKPTGWVRRFDEMSELNQ